MLTGHRLWEMKASRQTWLRSAAILLVVVTTASSASNQCAPQDRLAHVERFSAIKQIKNFSGPSGIELVLTEVGTRLGGVLRDYEGQPEPFMTKLKGTLRNCDVDVRGSSRRGSVEIQGTIMIASFEGTITRRMGDKSFSERVALRRELPTSDGPVAMTVVYPGELLVAPR